MAKGTIVKRANKPDEIKRGKKTYVSAIGTDYSLESSEKPSDYIILEVLQKKMKDKGYPPSKFLYIEKSLVSNFGHGGKMKQGYNDRMDDSLGNRTGKASSKEQDYKDRRDEAKAMNKAEGKRAYQSVGTMDKMADGGEIESWVGEKESKGYPVYVRKSGYPTQTISFHKSKELAEKKADKLGGKMASGGLMYLTDAQLRKKINAAKTSVDRNRGVMQKQSQKRLKQFEAEQKRRQKLLNEADNMRHRRELEAEKKAKGGKMAHGGKVLSPKQRMFKNVLEDLEKQGHLDMPNPKRDIHHIASTSVTTSTGVKKQLKELKRLNHIVNLSENNINIIASKFGKRKMASGGSITKSELEDMFKDDGDSWKNDNEFFKIASDRGFDYDQDKEEFVMMETFNDSPYGDDEEYADGGRMAHGGMADGKVLLASDKGIGGNKDKTYKFFKDEEGYYVIEYPSNSVVAKDRIFLDVNDMYRLFTGKDGITIKLDKGEFKKGGKTDDWIQGVEAEMEKKGTVGAFTKQAKRAGMTVKEFTKEVLDNPDKYSKRTRERAQFAKNVSKYESGGLFDSEGRKYNKKKGSFLTSEWFTGDLDFLNY